jgi:regulator of sirC expression with transglutaminase-like and TPR domain
MQSQNPAGIQPEGEIDLARGALLIARQAYPDLDVDHYLCQLDTLANDFRARHATRDTLTADLENLGQYLFVDLGFRGNQDHYDDPRNSYLNDVLDRRLGIPITLSVVYLELGHRLGLPLAGVNFPYHFLVRSTDAATPLFIDPFANGALIAGDELSARLPVIEGRKLELADSFLAPASPRHILARMLRNLKRIHVQQRVFHEAVHCAEKITWLLPAEAENYRDLGFLYYWIHEYGKAIDAFATYLRWAEDPSDAVEIQRNIQVISDRLSVLN